MKMQKYGFNISGEFFIYPKDMVTIKRLLNKHIDLKGTRFPGGTFAKEVQFSFDHPLFTLVVPNTRDAIYSKYTGYNKKNCPVWPFINQLTNNLTEDSEAKLVINLQTHYTKPARKELIATYKKLDVINTKAQLDSSSLSALFKSKVRDNINMYKALVDNRVKVFTLELCNEMFLAPLDNIFQKFTSDLNGVVWSKNKGETELSLAVFSSLCGLYCRLFRELDSNLKIGIPMAAEDGGGHAAYNAYLKKNKSIIGYDYEVKHLYGEKINMEGISVF